jgi:uncharacterized protein
MVLNRRDAVKALLAGLVGTGTGAAVHGYVYERHALTLVEEDLAVAGLAPEHDGLRVGFLTDLHHSDFVPATAIVRAVERLQAARPDLIVLGGDYVTQADRRYMGPCAELLAPLSAPHGVYAVMGNHDDDREMPAALTSEGITVLRDARTTLAIDGAEIDLAGVRFWTRQIAAIGRIIQGAVNPVLLLAHDPRRVVQAAELAVPAVLSGHTHGGQIVLPLVGPLPGRRFPIVAGSGRRENTTIYVSRGIGTVFVPIRINCPPEVTILQLRRRQSDVTG